MNVLDLFSGIGGFSLGLERAGMRTVAFCEIKPFARRVLAKHWPNVPCYDDVRNVTGDRLAADGIAVNVICGGFPCQDISSAGKGAGLDGARSGLWSEYARIIGDLRPDYVIVENVAILLSRGLGRVLGDLAALGYDAEWHCLPASAIGARHRRDRIWIVGYPSCPARGRDAGAFSRSQAGERGARPQHGHFPDRLEFASPGRGKGLVAYANNQRELQPEGSQQDQRRWIGDGSQDVADAERWRLQSRDVELAEPRTIVPAEIGRYCRGGELGETWRVEPDVGRVAYGLPHGMDRIEGLGNAVVPQIPEIIGRAIMNRVITSAVGQPTVQK